MRQRCSRLLLPFRPLCKRGTEGDLLFAKSLQNTKIKIKGKSPLAPLLQRGEYGV